MTIIYLDNQATTRVDPRVVNAMLPTFDTCYGNAGSVTHELGMAALELVEEASDQVAKSLGAKSAEIVFTSGATESNNLAIYGYCLRRHPTGHLITVATEHKSVLDPIAVLERKGFDVTRLPVQTAGSPSAGLIDLDQFAASFRDDTIFVSVMLANNEIGTIQPLQEIAKLCRERDVVLHTDATQAVGMIPVNVNELDVDLLSFSAHKFYGPKGVGALFVRQSGRRIRLASQIDGGGQQLNRRSGTLNVSGIVGLSTALQLSQLEIANGEPVRKQKLRTRLYERLCVGLGGLPVNGPELASANLRLTGNLNCQFPRIDGHAIMNGAPGVAVSSGSACTAAEPEPSHVLRAIGLNEDQIRSSIRFGLGRFNSATEIDNAADQIVESTKKLAKMRSNS